jgi:uncharacterized integral membrane protein
MTGTSTEHDKRSFLANPTTRRVVVIAVIVAISLIFIFENTAATTIRLIIPQVTMPLWGALLIAWVLGVLAGGFTLRRRR